MKYLILSDIHGSLPSLEKALKIYADNKCDMLCLLGDIINYGPRNGLPEGLDPKAIVDRLNAMAKDIVAVRGNCDSEVDQMLLQFPVLQDSMLLVDNGTRIWLTHGHIYNSDHKPSCHADVLFYGHTHLWHLDVDAEGTVVCNTGSPTFPKGGNLPTLAIYENRHILVLDMDGNILKELQF